MSEEQILLDVNDQVEIGTENYKIYSRREVFDSGSSIIEVTFGGKDSGIWNGYLLVASISDHVLETCPLGDKCPYYGEEGSHPIATDFLTNANTRNFAPPNSSQKKKILSTFKNLGLLPSGTVGEDPS